MLVVTKLPVAKFMSSKSKKYKIKRTIDLSKVAKVEKMEISKAMKLHGDNKYKQGRSFIIEFFPEAMQEDLIKYQPYVFTASSGSLADAWISDLKQAVASTRADMERQGKAHDQQVERRIRHQEAMVAGQDEEAAEPRPSLGPIHRSMGSSSHFLDELRSLQSRKANPRVR